MSNQEDADLKTPGPESAPEIRIDSLAAGGDGVGRLDGLAVFVPGAVPGDLLRVRIGKRKSSWARAEIESIIEAGPTRREAPCPVASDCGGCQWLQVDDAAQRVARQTVVTDVIARIADVADCPEPVFAPAPAELGYRRRAEYRLLAKGGGELLMGFLAPGSHRVVRHETCLLLEPALAAAVADLRTHLEGRPIKVCSALIEFTLLADGSVQLLVTLDDAARRELPRLLSEWKPDGPAPHIGLRDAEGRQVREAPGAPYLLENVELPLSTGEVLRYGLYTRPGEFIQSNRLANHQLLKALMEQFDPAGDPWVLDLFCGSGNFTLPLALRGAKVLGVETRRMALRSARKAARSAGTARARFRAGSAEELLPEMAAEGRSYRTVVLDPPRQGAPELAAHLDPLKVEEILAVSCHPASFARDLGAWTALGFRLESLHLFDFFPQTHHVELLAHIVRN